MWFPLFVKLCVLLSVVFETTGVSVMLVTGPEPFVYKPTDGSEREINVVNEMDRDIWVQCRDKNSHTLKLNLQKDQCYKFEFSRSFWGTTHYWCNAWYGDKPTHFPAYNEGAPSGNNLFVLWDDGVFMKNSATMKFELHRMKV